MIEFSVDDIKIVLSFSMGLNIAFLISYLFYCIREFFEFLKSKK